MPLLKVPHILECKNLAIDISERIQTLFVVDTLNSSTEEVASELHPLLGTALNLKPILKLQMVPLLHWRKYAHLKAINVFLKLQKLIWQAGRVEYLGVLSAIHRNSAKRW
jgi:hypothetical protein